MVKKLFCNLFNGVFSTGFANGKLRKHCQTLDLVSAVCQNSNKKWYFAWKTRNFKMVFPWRVCL